MQEPNSLAIYALCMLGAGGLIFILWLNHKWVTRGRRKSEAPQAQARAGALEYVVSYILGGAGPVNDYGDDVMSRGQDSASQRTASALETDARQTPDRRMIPVPTDQEMLDIFRVMRAAGIKREAISGVWRAAGLPLNNNVWSKAEPLPPEHPAEHAPISGRPLPPGAKFHDDPELEYQPLR